MKRVWSVLTALCLLLSLSSCGSTVRVTESAEEAEQTQETEALSVDYDLTTMSSEMVYALVYQMLTNPEEYTGKTVRMSGQYYASYYSVTELYYHYCIIADASACCSQGMEFVLSEEGLRYPEDYPENYTEVVVVGTFGTYEELGTSYCCLLEASLSPA